MERSAVVGALMICGSFLIAATLNRSAMDVVPPAPVAVTKAPTNLASVGFDSSPAVLDRAGFYSGDQGLLASQRTSGEIGYTTTAGSSRVHTYKFRQSSDMCVDWFRLLSSNVLSDGLGSSGMLIDPDCNQSGRCLAKQLEETSGLQCLPATKPALPFADKAIEGWRDGLP